MSKEAEDALKHYEHGYADGVEWATKDAERRHCNRCQGTGWLEPIGPKSDGSYITSRPCPQCDAVWLR